MRTCLLIASFIAVISMYFTSNQALAEPDSASTYVADKVSAKAKTTTRKIQKIQKVPSINLSLHAKLQQAQQILNEDKNAKKALVLMEKIKQGYKNFNPYERAIFWNIYAYIYYTDTDYSMAQFAYEQVLKQSDLPEALHTGALYNLAQIHFIQENYQQAVGRLETWFELNEASNAAAYILLGQGYYQLKNYSQAIPAIQQAISITRKQGKQVKENWYLLLRAMYYRQMAYKETLDILKILVKEYPKKEYYAHIASLYAQLDLAFEQYSTFTGMADSQLLDKGEELFNYAQLLLQNKRPYRAARLLEEGQKTEVIAGEYKYLKLLATAWILAKENTKAIPVLEKAAKLSSSGEDYLLLAQSYFSEEAWLKAQNASQQALQKGKLKKPDVAYMLLGMTFFKLQKYDDSLVQFSKAKQNKRSHKLASQWEKYVKSERTRQQRL